MANIPYSRAWENWAPLVARLFLALQIGVGAFFKVIAFSMEVQQTGAVGVPFPTVAVALALVLEVAGVIALLTGWQLRRIATLLAFYVALLAVLFYHNWSDQMMFGLFMSHLGLIAALLYVSVFGAKHHSSN